MRKEVLALDTQVRVLYFSDNKSAFVDDYVVPISLTETESDRKTKNGKGELLHTLVFLYLIRAALTNALSVTDPSHPHL